MGPRGSYPMSLKKEVVAYAKSHSQRAAAEKFKVDRKSIRGWMKKEGSINLMSAEPGKQKRKRLSGGGSKIKYPEIEELLHSCNLKERLNKRSVSSAAVFRTAKKIFSEWGKRFSGSRGWYERFLKRRNLSLRRRTTTAQKPPSDYLEKLASFVLFSRKLQQENKYPLNSIIGCDETAVWFDMPSETTLETTGAKEVTVKTTGHEKARVTVMLTAKADGTKMKPFVLLNRKRPIKELEKFKNKLVIKYAGTTWMNADLTRAYISEVLPIPLFGRRLLVWDSFRCHIQEDIKNELQRRKIDMLVVPGGCTKFVQPADVSWNRPFKERMRAFYEDWMVNGKHETTKGGNLKAVPVETVMEWVVKAWESLSRDLVAHSFKCCGISVALDGSEDGLISVFKEGKGCEKGLELLQK